MMKINPKINIRKRRECGSVRKGRGEISEEGGGFTTTKQHTVVDHSKTTTHRGNLRTVPDIYNDLDQHPAPRTKCLQCPTSQYECTVNRVRCINGAEASSG